MAGCCYQKSIRNSLVVRQTWGSNTLDIIYDNQAMPYACIYNGTTYYYILNLQGDVICASKRYYYDTEKGWYYLQSWLSAPGEKLCKTSGRN